MNYGGNTFCDKIFTQMHDAIERMVHQYDTADKERNHRNYGTATALAFVLEELGHDVDLRMYDIDGYDVTDGIFVDGENFEFYHKSNRAE